MTTNRSYLEDLRILELHSALDWLEPPREILEIGAGVGWQSRELSRIGHSVVAIDVPGSQYYGERIWPIRDYDGRSLPFRSSSFEVIFSSNVLEHVADLDGLLVEMRRVVRPGGYLIHVVPSATWRLWTSISYYPYLLGRVMRVFLSRKGGEASSPNNLAVGASCGSQRSASTWSWQEIGRRVTPPRHGERGSAFGELMTFRRDFWKDLLTHADLEFVECRPAGVFYSGSNLFGYRLPFRVRRALARILGSSCHVFVMKRRNTPQCNLSN